MDTIFAIDNEPLILDSIKDALEGLEINTFSSPLKALEAVKKNKKYLFIIDYRMPKMSGLDFLIEVKKRQIFFKALLLTAYADKDILENAINQSLLDKIVEKPFHNENLLKIVTELLKEESDDVETIRKELYTLSKETKLIEKIIGLDSGLIDVYKKVKAIAPIDFNVLITGETGSGKELIADLIHYMSPRKNGPLIKLNCATFPESLINSELFGYVKGAFSGADKTYAGKIMAANHGTLFLDEIGDLKPELQTKLFRVIEDKVIIPLGSNQEKKVDFRLIAATNLNIEFMDDTKFRKELLYRLNIASINLPPLRERKADIGKLAQYIISKTCKKMGLTKRELSNSSIALLEQYEWLGNIRELEGVIVKAIISSLNSKKIDDETIRPFLENKPRNFNRAIDEIALDVIEKKLRIKDIQKNIIKALAKHCNNNVQEIMNVTNFSRASIYRILNEKK